jgi:hypothetical protein
MKHMIIVGIYVNDCLIIGKELSISDFLNKLKKYEFNLKTKNVVLEYLSIILWKQKDEENAQ